jgi:hypothetical protein
VNIPKCPCSPPHPYKDKQLLVGVSQIHGLGRMEFGPSVLSTACW